MTKRKGPPEPLRLGEVGQLPALVLRAGEQSAELELPATGEHVLISRRAGGVLTRWLTSWLRDDPAWVPELIGVKGMMQEAGCSKRTLYLWRKRPGFPEPLPVTGGGPVWEAAAFRTWLLRDRPVNPREKRPAA